MFQSKRRVKILDFDIENRPLAYWYDDIASVEITAIASCWVDDLNSLQVHLLGRSAPEEMLKAFVTRYNEADMVTGHNIRRHDLPIINGALMEYGLPQLEPKLTCDTRWDLRKKAGIPASQEFFEALFETPIQKQKVSHKDWRSGNRFELNGMKIVDQRVTSDVLGHILMRNDMLKRNLLKAPRVWKP